MADIRPNRLSREEIARNFSALHPPLSRSEALIEAEDFVRFEDSTTAHSGDCGSGPVDQQVTSDTGGGCNIGWTAAGEWLEYDVEVTIIDHYEDEDDSDTAPVSAEISHLHDHDSGETGSLRDNLRLIKGVGPAIEKTLNELGIFRFHQIAEMTEYDIDRVAQRLKGFRTRIYREDWIGQARDLQLQKSGT